MKRNFTITQPHTRLIRRPFTVNSARGVKGDAIEGAGYLKQTEDLNDTKFVAQFEQKLRSEKNFF